MSLPWAKLHLAVDRCSISSSSIADGYYSQSLNPKGSGVVQLRWDFGWILAVNYRNWIGIWSWFCRSPVGSRSDYKLISAQSWSRCVAIEIGSDFSRDSVGIRSDSDSDRIAVRFRPCRQLSIFDAFKYMDNKDIWCQLKKINTVNLSPKIWIYLFILISIKYLNF